MTDAVRVYFDTMLYLNKFQDPFTIRPETNHMFNKVKSGEFRLIVSQTTIGNLPCSEFGDRKNK